MPVFKRNYHAPGAYIRNTFKRIRRETRLSLFAIGNDWRTALFETTYGVPKSLLGGSFKCLGCDPASLPVFDRGSEIGRTRNASYRFSWQIHGSLWNPAPS